MTRPLHFGTFASVYEDENNDDDDDGGGGKSPDACGQNFQTTLNRIAERSGFATACRCMRV